MNHNEKKQSVEDYIQEDKACHQSLTDELIGGCRDKIDWNLYAGGCNKTSHDNDCANCECCDNCECDNDNKPAVNMNDHPCKHCGTGLNKGESPCWRCGKDTI